MSKLIDKLYRSFPTSAKSGLFSYRLSSTSARLNGNRQRIVLRHEIHENEDQYRIRFERSSNEIAFFLNLDYLGSTTGAVNAIWKRLPVMVRYLSLAAPSVREGWVNISDGINVQPGDIAFCSNEPAAILVPDRFFMNGRSYAPYRARAIAQPSYWSERATSVVWRGGINGHGLWSNATMSSSDTELKQRVRMCLATRGIANANIKLTGLESAPDYCESMASPLRKHDVVGERIPSDQWWGIKFAIDIDGVTNAWSNLFTRLLMGCCVIKIESPFGYKQWYYEEMEPFEHYVPAKADLSDLRDVIGWCMTNDRDAQRIALAGQLFAMRRNPESETFAVVQKINATARS